MSMTNSIRKKNVRKKKMKKVLVRTLMRPPKDRDRGCFLVVVCNPWWFSLLGVTAVVVCLTSCTCKHTITSDNLFVKTIRNVSTSVHVPDLADQLLLLGRVGHVLVDVSEELLQRLLRVLLSRRLVRVLRAGAQSGRPFHGQRSPLSRRVVHCQQLQVILGERKTEKFRPSPGASKTTRLHSAI